MTSDKPILDVLDVDTSLEDRHRNVLKGFYSVFKVADSHLQFVLLTGVTKFSQVSVFSGFNQPKDISMDARYETLCGAESLRKSLTAVLWSLYLPWLKEAVALLRK